MRQAMKLLAVAAASVLLLTGCVSTTLPEFDREQTERDRIPDPTSEVLGEIDPSSTRYSGDVEAYQVYLGLNGTEGVCVILVSDGEPLSASCGGAGVGTELESGTRIEAGEYSVAEGEREQLSESVWVIPAS